MSRSTASGRGSAAISMNPASRVSASTASKPSVSSQQPRSSRNIGSSSTTRMRCFILSPRAGDTVVQSHNGLDASNHELYQRAGRRASESWGRGNQGPDQDRNARWKVLNATTLSPRQNLGKRFPGLPYTNKTPEINEKICNPSG